MIRCSSTSLKFANAGKFAKVGEFLKLYREAVSTYVDRFWDSEKVEKFASDITLDSPLTARAKQCAAKQALAIIAGTKKKFNARAYRIKKLLEAGEVANTQRLQQIQLRNPISKPSLDNINAELDQRFVQTLNVSNSFDLWIRLQGLGISKPIAIPLRKHKHFNKLNASGKLKASVRVSENEMVFFFEIPAKVCDKTDVLGIDLGSRKTFACSDGQAANADAHGWTLNKIQKRLSKRKKGSKGFARTQTHRDNYVRWSLNNLDFANVGEVKLEDLKNMRRGKRLNRFLQAWNHRDIVGVVKRKCEERGVRVTFVPRQYTSQRCSNCGKVEKSNRRAERYECGCGFVCDADVNAAKNIAILSEKVLDFRRWRSYSPPDSKNVSAGELHDLPCFS